MVKLYNTDLDIFSLLIIIRSTPRALTSHIPPCRDSLATALDLPPLLHGVHYFIEQHRGGSSARKDPVNALHAGYDRRMQQAIGAGVINTNRNISTS